jgi:hypothetical protein
MNIELTSEQSAILARNGDEPTRVIDPASSATFVLVPENVYDRLKSLLVGEDDVETLYSSLAEISPEDWEDPAVYGIRPTS